MPEPGLKVYKFNVEMTCKGCSNAVERVMSKEPKIKRFDINLPDKIVTVEAINADEEEVSKILKRTGKNVTIIS